MQAGERLLKFPDPVSIVTQPLSMTAAKASFSSSPKTGSDYQQHVLVSNPDLSEIVELAGSNHRGIASSSGRVRETPATARPTRHPGL